MPFLSKIVSPKTVGMSTMCASANKFLSKIVNTKTRYDVNRQTPYSRLNKKIIHPTPLCNLVAKSLLYLCMQKSKQIKYGTRNTKKKKKV